MTAAPGSSPSVTVVLVLYGDAARAASAIAAVRRHTARPHEITVVDNASPDGAARVLEREVAGITLIANPENHGFGTAANIGAARSDAPYLVFLNPDTEIQPGCIDHLTDALDRDPLASVATPLFLHPSGAVQEAGVVLGVDGTGYGYGDRFAPGDPEVDFRRYVDYGSAAAIAVRRPAFERAGGFDPDYGLGYYEDADLGFALRELGDLTVFEPRARVVHHRNGSFSARRRVRLSDRNRTRFATRFAGQLESRPRLSRPPYDPHRELIVRDWWAPERFLLVDTGGELGPVASYLQSMRPRDRVTHVTVADVAPDRPRGHPGVERFDRCPDPPGWLRARRWHYSAVVSGPTVGAAIRRMLAATQPQAVRSTPPGGPPEKAAGLVLQRAGIRPEAAPGHSALPWSG